MGSPWSTTDEGIFFEALHVLTAAGHFSPHDALWSRLDCAINSVDVVSKRLGMQACQTLLTLETLREIYDPVVPPSTSASPVRNPSGHDFSGDPSLWRQWQAAHLDEREKRYIAEIAMLNRDSLDDLQPFAMRQLLSLRPHNDSYVGTLESATDATKAPLDDFAVLILVAIAQAIPRYAKFAGFVARMALADVPNLWEDEDLPPSPPSPPRTHASLPGYQPTRLTTILEVDEESELQPPSPNATKMSSLMPPAPDPSDCAPRAPGQAFSDDGSMDDDDQSSVSEDVGHAFCDCLDCAASLSVHPHVLSPVIEVDEQSAFVVSMPDISRDSWPLRSGPVPVASDPKLEWSDEDAHTDLLHQIQTMQWPTLTGRRATPAERLPPSLPSLSLPSGSSSRTHSTDVSATHSRAGRVSPTYSPNLVISSDLSLGDLFNYLSASDSGAEGTDGSVSPLVLCARLLRRCRGYDDLRGELEAMRQTIEYHQP